MPVLMFNILHVVTEYYGHGLGDDSKPTLSNTGQTIGSADVERV